MKVNTGIKRYDDDIEEEQGNKFARLPYYLADNEPGYINVSEIKVHNLNYDIAKKPFKLKHGGAYLKIVSPLFSASGTVEIPPLPESGHYQVGWIKVCTNLQFIYIYGNEGIGSWEIPELVTGKFSMINAGEGVFPWHGSMDQVGSIKGPTFRSTFASVNMKDKLSAGIKWNNSQSRYGTTLTYVYRKQRFYAFLVLKDVNTNIFQIIQALTWSSEFAIDVNSEKSLDKRATFLGPHDQDIPRTVPSYLNPPLESSALNPPNAKDAQVYVWRPKKGRAGITLPASTTYRHVNLSLTREGAVNHEIVRLSKMKYPRHNDD